MIYHSTPSHSLVLLCYERVNKALISRTYRLNIHGNSQTRQLKPRIKMLSHLNLLRPSTWSSMLCPTRFHLIIAGNQADNNQKLEKNSHHGGEVTAIVLYDPNNGTAAQAAFDARLQFFLEMEAQPVITPAMQKEFDDWWMRTLKEHERQRFLDDLAKDVFEKHKEQKRKLCSSKISGRHG